MSKLFSAPKVPPPPEIPAVQKPSLVGSGGTGSPNNSQSALFNDFSSVASFGMFAPRRAGRKSLLGG